TRFDCDWSSDVCSSDLGVKFFQSLAGLIFAGGGQMGVNDRGVQRGVAQILADEPQADPLFQEMSGVTVPQSMNHRFGVNATFDRSEERRVGKGCRVREC